MCFDCKNQKRLLQLNLTNVTKTIILISSNSNCEHRQMQPQITAPVQRCKWGMVGPHMGPTQMYVGTNGGARNAASTNISYGQEWNGTQMSTWQTDRGASADEWVDVWMDVYLSDGCTRKNTCTYKERVRTWNWVGTNGGAHVWPCACRTVLWMRHVRSSARANALTCKHAFRKKEAREMD